MSFLPLLSAILEFWFGYISSLSPRFQLVHTPVRTRKDIEWSVSLSYYLMPSALVVNVKWNTSPLHCLARDRHDGNIYPINGKNPRQTVIANALCGISPFAPNSINPISTRIQLIWRTAQKSTASAGDSEDRLCQIIRKLTDYPTDCFLTPEGRAQK